MSDNTVKRTSLITNCDDINERMVNIFESLGVYKGISKAEIDSYIAGFDLVYQHMFDTLSAIYGIYGGKYRFDLWSDLTGLIFKNRDSDVNKFEVLQKWLKNGWMNVDYDVVSFLASYAFDECIIDYDNNKFIIGSFDINNIERIKIFTNSLIPAWFTCITDGHGSVFNKWDSFNKCWDELDAYKLTFDFIDSLEV